MQGHEARGTRTQDDGQRPGQPSMRPLGTRCESTASWHLSHRLLLCVALSDVRVSRGLVQCGNWSFVLKSMLSAALLSSGVLAAYRSRPLALRGVSWVRGRPAHL